MFFFTNSNSLEAERKTPLNVNLACDGYGISMCKGADLTTLT